MRIISQDGMMDFPYDNYMYFIMKYPESWGIEARYEETVTYGGHIIAEYSTKEKAIIAMELLRAKYRESKLKYCLVSGCIKDEFYEETMKGLLSCAYFRFPKDDEVEV